MHAMQTGFPQGPGPLNPWVRHAMQRSLSEHAQHGRDSLMHGAGDLERVFEENAGTICIAGLVLGTFVDTLLPVALVLGGLKLWRSMQQ